MKSQEKFGLLFWIFVLFSILWGLTGCSKTEPEVLMSEVIKQDVKVIEKQIEVVKDSIPVQCRTKQLDTQLDTISIQVKNISAKADVEVAVCEKSKEVYTQQISKLQVIIFGLIIACVLLVFVMVKSKLLQKIVKNWN